MRHSEEKLGVQFTDYQLEAMEACERADITKARFCLYYKTGAGKTITSLAMAWELGATKVLVIAPPIGHAQWREQAVKLDLVIETISHSKFRQKDYKLDRSTLVIADEFHLFGGHTGKGWKKLDGLSRGLKAPIILASATPNYNDAERVYCIQHILDPTLKGGFLDFIYANCITRQNPHSMIPLVDGFQNYGDAAEYLAALPGVLYLEDDLVWDIEPVPVRKPPMKSVTEWGYNATLHKMIASDIEARHLTAYLNVCLPKGGLRDAVRLELLNNMGSSTRPVLLFCAHSTIADAVYEWLQTFDVDSEIITGKTSLKEKESIVRAFNQRKVPVLVGTASLATGTDGMDKVCDMVIIVDDTDDAALRRQLVGRIMPRGLNTPKNHGKRVLRLEFY